MYEGLAYFTSRIMYEGLVYFTPIEVIRKLLFIFLELWVIINCHYIIGFRLVKQLTFICLENVVVTSTSLRKLMNINTFNQRIFITFPQTGGVVEIINISTLYEIGLFIYPWSQSRMMSMLVSLFIIHCLLKISLYHLSYVKLLT